MARKYTDAGSSPEDEFAYRRGQRKQYQQKLEELASGKPYDDAGRASDQEARRQSADALAASRTRNIGAVGAVSDQMFRRAAANRANLELDKFQSQLGAMESLREMDTDVSQRQKEQRDYDTMIRKFANEEAGIWDEQAETANYIQTLIDTESDPELVAYLEKRKRQISNDLQEGDVYEDV